jgi:tRNA(Ile)-lysidine synthase TilS/MesJ
MEVVRVLPLLLYYADEKLSYAERKDYYYLPDETVASGCGSLP